MNTRVLSEILERAKSWPERDQAELLEFALEIEARQQGEEYQATPEELEAIDRGLEDARAGRFATEEEVAAVFAKYRGR
jgi:predicted transcriptional regulator